MVNLRVLNEAYQEILRLDPKTAVSKNLVRQLALTGKVKTVMAGRRRLINVDDLIEYLANPPQDQAEEVYGIRPVPPKIEYRR